MSKVNVTAVPVLGATWQVQRLEELVPRKAIEAEVSECLRLIETTQKEQAQQIESKANKTEVDDRHVRRSGRDGPP